MRMGDIQNFASYIDFYKTPDGIAIRYGYWPSHENKIGIIVLLNGRSEFLEKYKEPIFILNSKGFDVFSLDWRGQGLSQRLLPHHDKGFVYHFDDYLWDLDTGLSQVISPKADKPIVFLAHSMGGHILLRYWLEAPDAVSRIPGIKEGKTFFQKQPDLIYGSILSSPMIDIQTPPFPGWFVKMLSHTMVKIGYGEAYALGNGDYRPEDQRFKGNLLTSDPERFFDHVNAVRNNPELALGGVTYGWLKAAFESISVLKKSVSTPNKKFPLLIAGAENDQIVSIKAQKKVSRIIANSEFKLIFGAKHEILKETDPIQAQFWSEFDHFIGKMP